MEGKIKKLIDGEYAAFPVTVSDAVYVDDSKTLKQKLEEMRNGISGETFTYVVELDRWGIKQGTQGKPPYSLAQWELAYNNVIGVNKALAWADANGLGRVVMPKGTYSFIHTNLVGGAEVYQMKTIPIKLFSNQILDLNGSTFEVMFDSANKSPYDLSPETTPAWKIGGRVIEISGVYNAHVINGKIIGDIVNRSFTDGGSGFNSEKGMEQTYGIFIDASSYCSVENIDVSMFMGDGICMGAVPYSPGQTSSILNGLGNTCSPGYMGTDGIVIAQDGSYISPEYPIDPKKFSTGIQMRTGGGYTRIVSITAKHFEYIFLDSNKTYITRKKSVYLEKTMVPYNAAYVRVQFVGEAVGLTSFTSANFDITRPQNHNIKISSCLIHDNHRGGISGGADFSLVEYCQIYRNGEDSGIGVPLFPDTTRYGINFEDSYCNMLIIKDNEIGNCFNGLLMGVYHARIEGNYIHNTSGVVVYNNASTFISNNVFYNAGLVLSGNNVTQERNINFTNNTVYSQVFSVDTTSHPNTRVNISNNNIYQDQGNYIGQVTLTDNYIKAYTGAPSYASYAGITFKPAKMVNNTVEDFRSANYYRTTLSCDKLSSQDINNNTFTNVTFSSGTVPNNALYLNSKFTNCSLENPIVDRTTSSNITFTRCELVNCNFSIGGVYTNDVTNGGMTVGLTFEQCRITIDDTFSTATTLVNIQDNKKYTEMTGGVTGRQYEVNFNDTVFDCRAVTNTYYMMKYTATGSSDMIDQYGTVKITNSTIILKDSTKFLLLAAGNARKAIVKGTEFIGFSSILPADTNRIKTLTDTYTVRGNIAPDVDKEKVCWFNTDNNKTYWWNSTNSTWVDTMGVPFSGVSNLYVVGNIKNNPNPVSGGYLGWVCTTAGYDVDTAWTATTNYSLNALICVGTNIYKCSQAGKTGSVSPSHTSGTATDGTAKWDYLGTKAVLSPYGLIS